MAPLAIYSLIDADYALWPTSNETFADLTRPNGTGYYGIGYKLITQVGFKEIHIADDTTNTFVLPYSTGKVVEKKH